jgi:hypothetical protein
MADINFKCPWWISPWFVIMVFATNLTIRSERNSASYTARLLSVRAQWTSGPFVFEAGGYLLKTIFSIYFTREGYASIEGLPKKERFNSAFFTRTILPNIIGSMVMPRSKIWPKTTGYVSTMLHLTVLFCHFRKLKSWDSPDWSSRLIPLTWHSVISSDSVTWRKNSIGRTSGPTMRWSLWWELCDHDPHSNAVTSLWRMDREITRMYCEWNGVDLSKYPWFDMLSLLVREVGWTARTFGPPHTLSRFRSPRAAFSAICAGVSAANFSFEFRYSRKSFPNQMQKLSIFV